MTLPIMDLSSFAAAQVNRRPQRELHVESVLA